MASKRNWALNILWIGAGILLALFVIGPLLLRGLTHGTQAQEGMRNRENLSRVKAGMTKQQALAIMGPPLSTRVLLPMPRGPRDYPVTSYVYTSSPLASDVLSFTLGPDNLVEGTWGYGD